MSNSQSTTVFASHRVARTRARWLTMTWKQASAFSRRDFRLSFAKFCPLEHRGRRESRAPTAPAASRANEMKHTSVVTTGSAGTIPAFPARLVLTAYSELFPVSGLVCHRRRRDTSRQLSASVAAPGPHGFAVRLWRFRPVKHHLTPGVHRIPRPTFCDDRETPLLWARDTVLVALIWVFGKAEYFYFRGLT